MTKTLQDFKQILDEVDFDFPILIDFEVGPWYRDNREIHWNTDSNLKDLYNGDGDTYSGWMREGYTKKDGYLITNLDFQTGTMITSIFDLRDEVSLDKLEEEFYED